MFRRQLVRQSRIISESLSRPSRLRNPPLQRFLQAQPLSSRSASAVPPRLWRRWQSTESDGKPSQLESETKSDSENKELEKDDLLKKELEQKNREIIDLKVGTTLIILLSTSPELIRVNQDKYLRSVADFRNLQERTKRDVESARQFAIQRLATDLLDSLDNLERALESVPQESLALDPEVTTTSNTSSSDPNVGAPTEAVVEDTAGTTSPNTTRDLLNLYAGLKMTEEILMSTLKKHGLERFDPMEGEGRKFDPRLDEATFFTRVEGKQDGDVFHTQSKGFMLNGRVIRAAKVGVVKNS